MIFHLSSTPNSPSLTYCLHSEKLSSHWLLVFYAFINKSSWFHAYHGPGSIGTHTADTAVSKTDSASVLLEPTALGGSFTVRGTGPGVRQPGTRLSLPSRVIDPGCNSTFSHRYSHISSLFFHFPSWLSFLFYSPHIAARIGLQSIPSSC